MQNSFDGEYCWNGRGVTLIVKNSGKIVREPISEQKQTYKLYTLVGPKVTRPPNCTTPQEPTINPVTQIYEWFPVYLLHFFR